MALPISCEGPESGVYCGVEGADPRLVSDDVSAPDNGAHTEAWQCSTQRATSTATKDLRVNIGDLGDSVIDAYMVYPDFSWGRGRPSWGGSQEPAGLVSRGAASADPITIFDVTNVTHVRAVGIRRVHHASGPRARLSARLRAAMRALGPPAFVICVNPSDHRL